MSLTAFATPIPTGPSRQSTFQISHTTKLSLPSIHKQHVPRRAALIMASESDDLLVVGCGVLGRLVGQQWRTAHPHARIVGETRTDAAHAELEACGLTPTVRGASDEQFANVVFCAPPSGNDDYAGEVATAARRATHAGRAVFTSSGGVFADLDGVVTERSAVADSERAQRLLGAEDAVLRTPGGAVLRLSGLYQLRRGPHKWWLETGEVRQDADGVINMLHYEDAAAAVVAALTVPELPTREEGRVFLIGADEAVTRKEMCELARQHPEYQGKAMPTFQQGSGVRLRRYDGSWSRKALNWKPVYRSFGEFMRKDAERVATESQ